MPSYSWAVHTLYIWYSHDRIKTTSLLTWIKRWFFIGCRLHSDDIEQEVQLLLVLAVQRTLLYCSSSCWVFPTVQSAVHTPTAQSAGHTAGGSVTDIHKTMRLNSHSGCSSLRHWSFSVIVGWSVQLLFESKSKLLGNILLKLHFINTLC